MKPERTAKPKSKIFKDLTGHRYGMLVVNDYWCRDGKAHHLWLCKCDCGRETLARGNNLRTGNTISCGCQHSGGRATERHGMHDTPEYSTWEHLVQRCRPEYFKSHIYSERGIEVCERWRNSFLAFYEDMGPRPEGKTIDRIDNEKGYEPGNCRWATPKEQSQNQRYIGNQFGKWKLGGGRYEGEGQ